ncbi:MAG: methyltransferase domain-containing protein [Gammaproteobacteria bacterium]
MAISILGILLALFAAGYWWRYRSLACPASLSWLVENPYMNAVAGPERIIQRLHLEKGMRLLDVGSGPGRLTVPVARRVGMTGEVVALDIQSRMLEKLGRRAEASGIDNIRLVNAGAGSGDLDKDHFDRALLVTVMGEIPNKHEALVEIYQALRQGGILSVTEVIPDPHYTSQKRVRALCLDAGFRETEFFGNWFAFTINFTKPVGA